ncbi:hypothetical protein EJ071_20090 [Mesorhizobium sp. M1B.F.Ca.ET.045.04.1.1]|nr:hypothetical protein EJ071_20090 [Mesorhizobium sp. M1B.F.Ca.ET.045.04.1.1]
MTINLQKPDITELKPRITVFGVGGGGGNAVNNMITAGLRGVEFVVANTDAQALTMSKSERLIQLGAHVTEGLGAGSQPEVGRAAAEECIDEIIVISNLVGVRRGALAYRRLLTGGWAREPTRDLTVGCASRRCFLDGQRRETAMGIEKPLQMPSTLDVITNRTFPAGRMIQDRFLGGELGCADHVVG